MEANSVFIPSFQTNTLTMFQLLMVYYCPLSYCKHCSTFRGISFSHLIVSLFYELLTTLIILSNNYFFYFIGIIFFLYFGDRLKEFLIWMQLYCNFPIFNSTFEVINSLIFPIRKRAILTLALLSKFLLIFSHIIQLYIHN